MSPTFLVMARVSFGSVPGTGHVPSSGGFWGEITELSSGDNISDWREAQERSGPGRASWKVLLPGD